MMGLEQVLPLWIRTDMRVMEMKEYSRIPRASELDFTIRCSLVHTEETLFRGKGGLTPLKGIK